VIVKGHPSHPGTGELFASAVGAAMKECKLPAGLFALLQGSSHELSASLVQHELTRAAAFTGSHRAGRSLFDLASRRASPIPVYAEMGSLNPVVILPEAVRERGEQIAQEFSASLLVGGGQFCTKPGVVLVVGDQERRFTAALEKHVKAAPQVNMLNRSLRDQFSESASEISHIRGLKSIVVGAATGHAGMSPVLFETTAGAFVRESRLHEEAFGPGGVVVQCDDAGQALACLESLRGNLTGTIHIGENDDRPTAQRLLRTLEETAGRVIVNGYPTGVEVGHAMVHGGPYPATTDPGSTSVGSAAIRRFVRPVAYQNAPQHLLPLALRNDNPLRIRRFVNSEWTERSW
jgi:NADP-dependent aldehyde dehydrogenase